VKLVISRPLLFMPQLLPIGRIDGSICYQL
jgi:hypothetical protein